MVIKTSGCSQYIEVHSLDNIKVLGEGLCFQEKDNRTLFRDNPQPLTSKGLVYREFNTLFDTIMEFDIQYGLRFENSMIITFIFLSFFPPTFYCTVSVWQFSWKRGIF